MTDHVDVPETLERVAAVADSARCTVQNRDRYQRIVASGMVNGRGIW
ncbi:hypothetical protein [Brevundimonas sp.]|nr:hypothetical protein [Brevundimonas sp.]